MKNSIASLLVIVLFNVSAVAQKRYSLVSPDGKFRKILFNENFKLIFRTYNDGIAYRFVSDLKKPFIVAPEQMAYTSFR